MSDAILHFLPWMRRGMARSLTTIADADGVPISAIAEVDASVSVAGTVVSRALAILGPGVVLGLAPEQIGREDPPAGSTDFEPNYFPALEVLSPDVPWMFTPATPNADKLLPWLCLVVVEEREGVALAPAGTGPLQSLRIDDAQRELPDLREAWAWTHVQAGVAIAGDVAAAFAARPEAFLARFMCPRRLAADTYYRACLVPVFEQGRRAGLGLAADANDVTLAWNASTTAIELPLYHAWAFRTAREAGDFESLVRALTAAPLAGNVGVRDLDVGAPGTSRLPAMPGTILGFQGALVSTSVDLPAWPAAHRAAFQPAMHDLLDETLVARTHAGAYDPRRDDPVLAPPAYGALAAGVDAVPESGAPATAAAPAWLADVNLDPAHRAAAGLGAEVVRRNQEALVASAWDQVAGIGSVNRLLARTRLALEAGVRQKARLDAWTDGALLQLTRGAHARLAAGARSTVHAEVQRSALPTGLVSAAFRRRVRPGTTLARATRTLPTAIAPAVTDACLANPTRMLAYAAFQVPFGTVFDDEAATTATMTRPTTTQGLVDTLTASGLVRRVNRPAPTASRSRAAAAVRAGFISSGVPIGLPHGGGTAVALGSIAGLVRTALDPSSLLASRVRALVTPSDGWTEPVPASVWADPAFPAPLYAWLAGIDPELMLPGARGIPNNSIGLARVNAAFVEAFLLGANAELVRELIWREFPADPAGTYLRTFWDSAGAEAEDISPVASWKPGALGSHQIAMDPARVLALVVKGEVLRRYPSTLIYAVPAKWESGARVEDRGRAAEQPIFVARLARDLTCLGFSFEVSTAEIIGNAVEGAGAPGWFFVFEQPPTAPRFGLDVGRPAQAGQVPRAWDDASWFHALGTATASHAPLGVLAGRTLPFDTRGANRWTETWGRSAAAMARITLQRPVRMLVHADQMLEAP